MKKLNLEIRKKRRKTTFRDLLTANLFIYIILLRF